jgi:tRNA (guanosine-2'-O-)-methyltransferase
MTPDRFRRLRAVLDRRQPDLTVLMDNVHKRHNFAAVMRTCDAVGVLEVHGVWPDPRYRPSHDASAGVGKWLPVRTHETIEAAAAALHARGFTIVAAHAAPGAVDFRTVDYARPVALLLGAELDGVSAAARDAADTLVVVPMAGMVESLNVSVAAAVILYEAQRQRAAAGLYDRCRLEPEAHARTLFEWAHPEVADWCRRHARPYPALDDEGDVAGKL